MKIFKNYLYIFLLSYIVAILVKFVFVIYLYDRFVAYKVWDILYAIFWGYRFDFAVSAFIAFIVTLFDFNKKIFSTIGSIFITLSILVGLGDILYFNEANRHISYEIADIFVDAKSLFLQAYSQYTIFTIITIVVAVVVYILAYVKISNLNIIRLDRLFLFKKILLLLVSIFFIRGGIMQHIPLNPWQSNQIGDVKLAQVALNPIYNIIYSLIKSKSKLAKISLPKISKYDTMQVFDRLYLDNNIKKGFPLIKIKPNVVFLFMESWSAKWIKSYGFDKNTTPNFDKLLKNSIRVKFMVANGHRTTEGMFATLCSYQNPLGKSIAKTWLQNNQLFSIIYSFRKEKYSSAFFQGTAKETSGTGSFAQTLGFEYSFGKEDVKKRLFETNYWGIHDVDLYNFVVDKLDNLLKEPFVIGINGATTHDDKIPNGIKKIDFVKDKNINNMLNALHFSDIALIEFIKKVEAKYPNTIFVLFADHCGGRISGTLKNYQIPFAIYSKQLIKPKKYNLILSQRDIAPTIYDLVLGDYKKDKLPFSGKSLFQDSKFFADYFANGVLGWIENNQLVELNIATNKINCFKIDNFHKTNHQCDKQDNILKINSIGFTTILQDLLFKDKIKQIVKIRYQNLVEK